jgi:hypothetical protein
MSLRPARPARAALVFALALIGGCSTPTTRPTRTPDEVRAQLVALLPASVPDRAAWAHDIERAFHHLELPPSTENLCAALAVTEQESTFTVDPEVPGLGRIARGEIDRRAARLKIPRPVVSAALKVASLDGRSYADRLAAVRTEKALSELYEELIGRVPLGKRLFAGANPVRSGGPMQVRIDFAERHARQRDYPYARETSIRHEVFTRRGGMYFGIAHLLKYPNRYDRHLFRFADFNAGWYASRNAAFQAAVASASGRKLVLDGDLILPDEGRDRVGATEGAVRALSADLDLDERDIRRALERGAREHFEQTELYERVFALAERRAGKALPRAVMPQIALESPKITRQLTTEWFATRVQTRYQRCVNRAFAR